MASFQAKMGWDWPRKREKKKLSFRLVPTRPGIENSKKIAKKFRRFKNIIMTSFRAKKGSVEAEKGRKKIIVPVSFYMTRNKEFQKNCKKSKKHHYGFFSSQNGTGLAEKEKKKLSFRSVTTRPGIENSKKIAKKFKKLKNLIMASFQAKIGWERQRKREKKIVHFDQFLLDPE